MQFHDNEKSYYFIKGHYYSEVIKVIVNDNEQVTSAYESLGCNNFNENLM